MNKVNKIRKMTATSLADLVSREPDSFDEYQSTLLGLKEAFNLSRVNFTHAKINNTAFRKAKILSGQFCFSDLKNVTFVDCDLSCTDFHGSEFNNAFFINCNLNMSKFHNAEAHSLFFFDCDLWGSDFSKSSMEDMLFYNCKLTNSKLDCCSVSQCYFIKSNLNNISTMGTTDLENSVFHNCENIPKSIQSKIDMDIFELKKTDRAYGMSKESASLAINKKKFSNWLGWDEEL